MWGVVKTWKTQYIIITGFSVSLRERYSCRVSAKDLTYKRKWSRINDETKQGNTCRAVELLYVEQHVLHFQRSIERVDSCPENRLTCFNRGIVATRLMRFNQREIWHKDHQTHVPRDVDMSKLFANWSNCILNPLIEISAIALLLALRTAFSSLNTYAHTGEGHRIKVAWAPSCKSNWLRTQNISLAFLVSSILGKHLSQLIWPPFWGNIKGFSQYVTWKVSSVWWITDLKCFENIVFAERTLKAWNRVVWEFACTKWSLGKDATPWENVFDMVEKAFQD